MFAALRLTRLFTPALAARGGSVVMINSAVLRHSRRTFGAYKMPKAALLALAQSLSTELGPLGVRVNTVAPGYIWADPSGPGTTLRGFFDVGYDDFVRDPLGAVEAVYAHFGLPLGDAARTAMTRLHDESRSGAGRPAHRYSLSDFGLTGEEIDERFAGYLADRG